MIFQLLEVSEKTTTELDLLHGKVESSRLADTHNQSALVEFEHNCSGHFHSLNGNLIQLQNSEKSVFQSAKEILGRYDCSNCNYHLFFCDFWLF